MRQSFSRAALGGDCPSKEIRYGEEFMALLEATIITLIAAVWLILLAVAGLFVFALVCETIESIRTGLFRRLRHSLHF
jgi:hypothetical protein